MTLRYPTHAGPDHNLYDHRRAAQCHSPTWPGNARAAAFILLRIETLEIETPADFARDPRWRIDFGNYSPEYRSHSLMEYGNRIGVFRLLDFLQPLGWRIAASVNGLVAHENPGLLRRLQARGVEIVAGGWSASRMISNAVSPDTERMLMQQSLAAIANATGNTPAMYSSQDYGYSTATPDILSELGITLAIDWPNDELPYLFGHSRHILMLPAAAELDDAQMVVGRRLQPPRWATHIEHALSAWAENAYPGSVLALPLHAWISGVPHRFTNLRKALGSIEPATFWQATPGEIETAWRARRASGA